MIHGAKMKKNFERTERTKDHYSIQSVENALSILEAFCESLGREMSVADLSGVIGMNKSLVFRVLATFEKRGYVEQVPESKKYILGLKAYEVSRKILHGMKILSESRQQVIEFSRTHNETVYICVPKEEKILMLDAILSTNIVSIKSFVGENISYDGNSAGNVFLAFGKFSSTHGKPPLLSKIEIDNIVKNKIAFDRDRFGENVMSISTPLFGKDGQVVACLCLIGPYPRLQKKIRETDMIENFKQAARVVSTRLGYLEGCAG